MEQIMTTKKEQKFSFRGTNKNCRRNKKLGRGTNKDFTENNILIHGTNDDYKEGTKI
jgi:hypothetical protein